jgi:hypothetical protein
MAGVPAREYSHKNKVMKDVTYYLGKAYSDVRLAVLSRQVRIIDIITRQVSGSRVYRPNSNSAPMTRWQRSTKNYSMCTKQLLTSHI